MALLSYQKTKKKDEDNSGSALVAYSQNRRERNAVKGSSSRGRSKSKDCGKGVQYNKCKVWGHIKRDYPTWDKKDSQGLESSTAVTENSEDPGDILIIFREDTYSQDDWVLYPGATNHICSRRKFFETFQESKEDTFSLPDGSKCDVMELGTVKVKIFDGVVCTLGVVTYVPKLRKNLISLSQLDSNGCKCFIVTGSHENHTYLHDRNEGRKVWRLVSSDW